MSNSSHPRVDIFSGDGAHNDAFSRLRTSDPIALFENKNIHARNSAQWTEKTSGSLSSVAHLAGKASVELTCGTEANAYALRQSVRYIPYVPGKSQLIMMTFDLDAGKTGVVNEIGYGDDNNGIFLKRNGGDISFVIRSNVSGTVTENEVAQTDWEIDRLNGSRSSKNRSGATLDLSKSNILVIDFQWLGVGRVRCGFDIDGVIIYCHEFEHAGLIDTTYMATPSLPVRYKIYNTQLQTTATAMREICCAVVSEGGYTPPGLEFSASHDIRGGRRSVSTRAPVFAIRLKSQYSASVTTNRRAVRLIGAHFSTNTENCVFELVHVHDPSSITAAWTSVSGGSGVEYSRDISAVTGNPSHIVSQIFVPAGQGNKADSADLVTDIINEHSYISQDFDSTNSQMFVVYATAETGTATVWASLTWVEID